MIRLPENEPIRLSGPGPTERLVESQYHAAGCPYTEPRRGGMCTCTAADVRGINDPPPARPFRATPQTIRLSHNLADVEPTADQKVRAEALRCALRLHAGAQLAAADLDAATAAILDTATTFEAWIRGGSDVLEADLVGEG